MALGITCPAAVALVIRSRGAENGRTPAGVRLAATVTAAYGVGRPLSPLLAFYPAGSGIGIRFGCSSAAAMGLHIRGGKTQRYRPANSGGYFAEHAVERRSAESFATRQTCRSRSNHRTPRGSRGLDRIRRPSVSPGPLDHRLRRGGGGG